MADWKKITLFVREARASWHNGGPLEPLDTIVLRCLRGLMGVASKAYGGYYLINHYTITER